MSGLIHLVYVSAASQQLNEQDIESILKISVTNNYASDITGMLLFSEGSFLQVLEGKEKDVRVLFQSIKQDSRHSGVMEIYSEKITDRIFGDWSMGLASLKYEELAQIPGCNDFFKSGQKLSFLQPSMAKLLLQAFKEGDFRSLIK